MILQIIFLSVSLAVILLIIGIRSIELKKEKTIVSQNFRDKSDAHLRKISATLATFCTRVWRLIILFIKKVIHFLAHAFIDVWEFLARKSVKYINAIRGKGVLKNKGSASFFMNAIMEHKEEVRSNRPDLNI